VCSYHPAAFPEATKYFEYTVLAKVL